MPPNTGLLFGKRIYLNIQYQYLFFNFNAEQYTFIYNIRIIRLNNMTLRLNNNKQYICNINHSLETSNRIYFDGEYLSINPLLSEMILRGAGIDYNSARTSILVRYWASVYEINNDIGIEEGGDITRKHMW